MITSLCLRLHLPPRSHRQSFAAQERAGKGRGTQGARARVVLLPVRKVSNLGSGLGVSFFKLD